MRRPSRWLTGLAGLVAVYLAYLMARYFFPPHVPRFRIETMLMWFAAVGLAAIWSRTIGPGAAGSADLPGSIDDPQALKPWHYGALFALFVFGVGILYGPALRVGFLSDDFVLADLAQRRQWIHDAQTGFRRPILPMFWALLSFVPLRFDVTLHLANMVLHAANALLVVWLAIRMSLRPGAAVAAGVLFATFSGVSEAVVWASGMQDVLMTTLALVAVGATLELKALGTGWAGGIPAAETPGTGTALFIAAVGSAALALGVKETAVAIPVLAWLTALVLPRRRVRIHLIALVTMTAIAAVYGVVRLVAGLPSGYSRVSRYALKQLLVEPFATLGVPWSATWIEMHPSAALVRSLIVLVLLVAVIAYWRRTDTAFRRALVCTAWVLAGVLPVFSFFYVSAQLEGGRYLYLSSAGFALLLATLIGNLMRRALPAQRIVFAGATVLALAVPSVVGLRSNVAVWTDAARLRDQILDAYVDIMPFARCSTVTSEGPVDGFNGAQVLRNGFLQAVAARGLEAPAGPEAFRCRVNWTGRIVVRQDE